MTPGHGSTVDGVLRRSARRTPERTAVTYRDRSWTYAELDEAVSRAAQVLIFSGLAPGDRVGAYGHNSDAYLIGFLACARAGLVHVPVNQNLTGDDLSYIVGQSGSTLVLADPGLADRLDGVRVVPLRDADDSLLARLESTAPYDGPEPRTEDLVQLLYTSGTTALPKGAMMTHRALVHEYLSAITALDLSAGDLPVHSLPLYHSAQMHVFLLPYLAVGAQNIILDAPDAEQLFDLIEAGRADSLFAPPTVWIGLSNRPDFATRDLSGLRKAYYGASIMPVPVLERLRERLPKLAFYNCFGQSEIGPLSMVLAPNEHRKARLDSCGRPVLFVDARVVDENGKDVPDGTSGEVVYRSPQLCEGYWDKPEETAEAFRDGWFHSGDLVVRDAQGYFTVVDRVKDVINSGGVLVASRQVEDALYTHPEVAEVAVIGLPDDRWIEAVTAVVVPRGTVTEDELVAHARENLAHFKAPKRVVFVDELPRNASGKILKRELRDRLGEA
ncbi:fatty-acyl-CoA synthase [Streptomyces phaeochromogenes]|uniref:acyl-CoA synthetase n=1 Tax=Streptomyces phaeochromogenes TaxID=1923 RepID=UPI00278EB688|nr:acyl-CoA synthetase [Streptomyces phaeochromogenes]MDQ0954821.1 fatty-acyl-CoA synthase [Streptomyces phaeochromogenes]